MHGILCQQCARSVQIEVWLKFRSCQGPSVCAVAGITWYVCDSQTDFVAASCYSSFARAILFA